MLRRNERQGASMAVAGLGVPGAAGGGLQPAVVDGEKHAQGVGASESDRQSLQQKSLQAECSCTGVQCALLLFHMQPDCLAPLTVETPSPWFWNTMQ